MVFLIFANEIFLYFCLLSPQFNDLSLCATKLISGNRWFQADWAEWALFSSLDLFSVCLCLQSSVTQFVDRGMASSPPIQSGFIIFFFLPFDDADASPTTRSPSLGGLQRSARARPPSAAKTMVTCYNGGVGRAKIYENCSFSAMSKNKKLPIFQENI